MKAADGLIVDYLRSTAIRLSNMQDQTSLTHCGRSFWDMSMIMFYVFLPRKAADSSIMDQCSLITPWYSKMQALKSLMLRWLGFSADSDMVVESIVA